MEIVKPGKKIEDLVAKTAASVTDHLEIQTEGETSKKILASDLVSGGGAEQLSDLTDVGDSTPTDKNVLSADGVDFESKTLDNADIVAKTGAQTVAGIKTFSSFPVTPSSAPTTDYQVSNKKYVDDTVHPAATVGGAPLTLSTQEISFNYDAADFQLDGNDLQVKDGGIDHNSTANLTTGDPHTQYLKEADLTTKGDIYAASGASTPARLGVGDDDQVLTADSREATGLKWAAGGAGGGEANTASNVGTGGVGIYKQKVGVDIELKKINAGSTKVTVTDDAANSEVDIDVAPESFSQFKGLAEVKLEYVSVSQIQIEGLEGTSENIYINGEFLDCSTPKTIDYDDNLLAADGTDSGGAATDAVLYYVYASNASASYRASGIGLSATAHTGGYLAAAGNGLNWRLIGWVYLIDNAGTAEFRDSDTERLVISKWNPRKIMGYNTEGTDHTYTTTSWRYYYNTLASTQIKFITHEDHLNIDLSNWAYFYLANNYCYTGIGIDGVSPISGTLLRFKTTDATFINFGAKVLSATTAGYHYAAILQNGAASSGSYRNAVITIGIMG